MFLSFSQSLTSASSLMSLGSPFFKRTCCRRTSIALTELSPLSVSMHSKVLLVPSVISVILSLESR